MKHLAHRWAQGTEVLITGGCGGDRRPTVGTEWSWEPGTARDRKRVAPFSTTLLENPIQTREAQPLLRPLALPPGRRGWGPWLRAGLAQPPGLGSSNPAPPAPGRGPLLAHFTDKETEAEN